MPDRAGFRPDDSLDPPDMDDMVFAEDMKYTLTEVHMLLKPEFLSNINEMLEVASREDEFTKALSELTWQAKELMDRSCTVAKRYADPSNRYVGNIHCHFGEDRWLDVSLPWVNHKLEIQPALITAGTHELSSCQAVYAFLKAYVPITKQYRLLWDVVQWYQCFIGREWHRESVSCGSLSELLKPFNEQIHEVLDGKT